MDISVFNQLLSNNQDLINYATTTIMSASKNSQFIFFLFEKIQDISCKSEPTLLKQICIHITSLIRSNWMVNDNYWTYQNQEEIAKTMIKLMFEVAYELRPHFIESFRYIILRSFVNALPIMNCFYEEIQDKLNLENINTFFEICYFWLKCSSEREKQDQNILDQIDQFNLMLIQFFYNFANNNLNYSDEQSRCSLLCFIKDIYKFTFLIAIPEFTDILNSILLKIFPLLIINSNDGKILKMKYYIVKIIFILNTSFLKKKSSKNELINKYSMIYKKEIANQLPNLIYQTLLLPMNCFLAQKTLLVYYQFIEFEDFNLSIITPELINIFIKLSMVYPDDIYQTIINPEQYLENYLISGGYNGKSESTRMICSSVFSGILEKQGSIQIIEQISEILKPVENDNDFVLEAKIYLLLVLSKSVKAYNRRQNKQLKKKGKKVHSNCSAFDKLLASLVEYIINSIANKEISLFLKITFLWFLSSVIKGIAPEHGIEISVELINKSEYPIEALAASKIFVDCWSKVENDDNHINLNSSNLIQKLLEISSVFSCNFPSRAIEICCINANNIDISSIGFLIDNLFNTVCNYLEDDVDKDPCFERSTTILNCIYNIISQLDDNDPQLLQLAELVVTRSFQIFTDFPENEIFLELFDLIGEFPQKTNQVLEYMISILPNYLKLLYNEENEINEDLLIASRQITMYIYPLITCENSPVVQNEQLTNALMELCQKMLEYGETEGTQDCLGYSLFLASCFIQVYGQKAFGFLDFAISTLRTQLSIIERSPNLIESDPIIFIGALHVLASALIVDAKTITILDESIIKGLVNFISEKIISTYREMTVAFIILLKITENGELMGFEKAKQMIQRLYILKKRESEEEFKEEEEEEETVLHLITLFSVPLDSFDPINYFNQIQSRLNQ